MTSVCFALKTRTDIATLAAGIVSVLANGNLGNIPFLLIHHVLCLCLDQSMILKCPGAVLLSTSDSATCFHVTHNALFVPLTMTTVLLISTIIALIFIIMMAVMC